MWCESSWASEALQIGRGGSRGRRPPQLLFPFSFLRDCWLHFLQASLQDTFVCFFTPLVFCSFSFFDSLVPLRDVCFFPRVSCCVCFCDFYSLLFFTFLSQLPLAAMTWRRSTWISQISPVCQNKIHSVTGTFIMRYQLCTTFLIDL